MNQAEVVHASWTHRDPPNMSLLDVCMADVRDTVIFETELEGIKNGTCKAGTRGPSYAELQKRRHDREVKKAKRAGKEMLKNTDGHLIDPKSSYQPKSRKVTSTKKRASQSQPCIARSSAVQNQQPSSVQCTPSSHHTYQTVLRPSVPQIPCPTVSQSTFPLNPYSHIQPMQMVFDPQPSSRPLYADE